MDLQAYLTPGFSGGNSWTFLPNNRFTEEDWYSGGAYWRHYYSGTYSCEAGGKTVFLKYDKEFDGGKGKTENFKGTLKMRLDLKTTEKDTILTITKGWEKSEELIPVPENTAIPTYTVGSSTFKIEHIADENSEKNDKTLRRYFGRISLQKSAYVYRN